MSDKTILKELIEGLREAISSGGLTKQKVDVAISRLSQIREYDEEKFPELPEIRFTDSSGATPQTLAEALLWKLGKWKVYKKFASNYQVDAPDSTKTDVVLFAFVKHLKDRELPIYDQHAIRALWAIDQEMEPAEEKLKSLLFDRKGKWKKTGSGDDTIDCYDLFLKRMKKIRSKANAPTVRNVDRLLMPLGQSIKRATNNYEEFRNLRCKS